MWAQPEWRSTRWPGDKEELGNDFESYVTHALKQNGVVFACIAARMHVFSQARFQYQRFQGGRPAELFGDTSLSLLENPWPNGTTGELLARMEQDASLAGNFFGTIVGKGDDSRIRRLRPDWVTILTGSPSDDPFDIEAQPIGYIYNPSGAGARKPTLLTPDQIVHYSPIPDPDAQWRGMSWISSVTGNVQAHAAAAAHKFKFFKNGTTSNFVVTYDKAIGREAFLAAVQAYREAHDGVDNAYKTIHLGGGSDVKTVGSTMQQLDFKATQGADETLIAAASGVGAVIAQLSEGLQGSSLNAGNFSAARRRFADVVCRDLWAKASSSLSKFAAPPAGARLWYDSRDIPFLQEDAKDAADIEFVKAQTIRQLVEAGFAADSVVAAVDSQDMTRLTHTGRLSVQLQDPATPAA